MSKQQAAAVAAAVPAAEPRQHGVKGVYYGGEWLDIEDCAGKFTGIDQKCSGCQVASAKGSSSSFCPRSKSRNTAGKPALADDKSRQVLQYDVLIIGAGCIGAAVARELSRYQLDILWVDAADDVAQGATKGNSGIVHAGYDDTPGTNRAKYCWTGNQMFAQLDAELRFGYQKNGSLVVAYNDKEMQILQELKHRGETNGVQRLQIIDKMELQRMEPYIHPDAIAALYSPDAGNVIPYEFNIALAENAVDNGVELRIRRKVSKISTLLDDDSSSNDDKMMWQVEMKHWEPQDFVASVNKQGQAKLLNFGLVFAAGLVAGHYVMSKLFGISPLLSSLSSNIVISDASHLTALLGIGLVYFLDQTVLFPVKPPASRSTPLADLVKQAGEPNGGGVGGGGGGGQGQHQHHQTVQVNDMLMGGSGSEECMQGVVVERETIHARYIINCAGGATDQVARLIGDDSFTIQPRLGDYILLNRNQGHLTKCTLFPCPDEVLGKGVLCQTTLWGNLILGPTARDVYKAEAREMSPAAIQEYILSKCKHLIPHFDAKEAFHAFCGARAKSTRGDWIIEHSAKNKRMILVAGIDSPGLAGSPAIAKEVVNLLKTAGLTNLEPNPTFNPNRAPIITPKQGMRGLKMGPVGKNDSADGLDEAKMAANVICKCEKVTELEVVRAMRRSLPIDTSQGIRKRTRAGMGHCQGDPENYNCEARVRAIIARENGVPLDQVGARPWPATSTLPQRWLTDGEKQELEKRMNP